MRCFPGVPVLPTEYTDALSYQEQISKIWEFLRSNIGDITPATDADILSTPEYYGAAGDGYADDREAFQKCADYCSANNSTMILKPGAQYYLSGTVNMNNSIEGNWAKIICKSSTYQINFTSSSNKNNYVVPASAIGKSATTDPELFGKSFFVTSAFPLGQRDGTGAMFYGSKTIITDKDGVYMNGDFPYASTDGSLTCGIIVPMDDYPITVRNLHFIASNPDNVCNTITMQRNNITFDGLAFTGACTYGSVGMNVLGSNITIKNVVGFNPNTVTSAFGYVISLNKCDHVTLENVYLPRLGGRWAAIAGSYAGNITFKNVYSDRFDVHYESWGHNVILDSCLNTVNLTGGIVDYDIRNTTLYQYSPFMNRTDLKMPICGTISLDHCTYSGGFGNLDMSGVAGHGDFSTVYPSLVTNLVFNNMAAISNPFNQAVGISALNIIYNNCIISPKDNSMYSVLTPENTNATFTNCCFPAGTSFVSTHGSGILNMSSCYGGGTIRIRNKNQIFSNNIGLTLYCDTAGTTAIVVNNIGVVSGTSNFTETSVLQNNLTKS